MINFSEESGRTLFKEPEAPPSTTGSDLELKRKKSWLIQQKSDRSDEPMTGFSLLSCLVLFGFVSIAGLGIFLTIADNTSSGGDPRSSLLSVSDSVEESSIGLRGSTEIYSSFENGSMLISYIDPADAVSYAGPPGAVLKRVEKGVSLTSPYSISGTVGHYTVKLTSNDGNTVYSYDSVTEQTSKKSRKE